MAKIVGLNPFFMRLGLSSFTFGWSVGVPGNSAGQQMTETDLVSKTLSAGLHLLQIGDNVPLHKLTGERRDRLKSLLTKNNITLEVGARKLTREHLHQYIDLAAFFNAPLLRFVIDGDQYEPDIPEIIAIVKDAVPALKQMSIVLGIENHDRFKARALAALMDAVGSEQVGICLDCVNSLGAGEGLDWVTSVLAPYTVNLHIKDFVIKRFSHNMGFTVEGTPAGKGMMEMPALMEKLDLYKRCKSAVLEQWVVPEKNMEDTLLKEQRWADESVQYLKGLGRFEL